MAFKWLTYLFIANLAYPFCSIYILFSIWGHLLKDSRVVYKIDGLLLQSNGAMTASIFGLFSTLFLTLPASIVFGGVVNILLRHQCYIATYAVGGGLGLLVGACYNHWIFGSALWIELPAIGLFMGVLLSGTARYIFQRGVREGSDAALKSSDILD